MHSPKTVVVLDKSELKKLVRIQTPCFGEDRTGPAGKTCFAQKGILQLSV